RAEHEQEHNPDPPDADTARACYVTVDRGEEQRATDDCEGGEYDDGHHTERRNLVVADAEREAEQLVVHAVEQTLVQRGEPKAAGKGERLHGADDRGLFAESVGTARTRGDRNDRGSRQAEGEIAD